MSWVLFSQIAGLMLLAMVLIVVGYSSVIDKRREDAIKRKENGL